MYGYRTCCIFRPYKLLARADSYDVNMRDNSSTALAGGRVQVRSRHAARIEGNLSRCSSAEVLAPVFAYSVHRSLRGLYGCNFTDGKQNKM